MNRSNEAQLFWDELRAAYPRRTRFALEHLLETFRQTFPHRLGDADARSVLAKLLGELEQSGAIRLPNKVNRRAYDHSERTPLPKHVASTERPSRLKQLNVVWRPELAFASECGSSLQAELLAIQKWLRNGGTAATPVALRERSVEIFGDEKRLDSLLGSQLFAPGRLTLELLRCYLPSVPIYVVSIPEDGLLRPLLVVENHTTFDTLCRWNNEHRRYSAVAFGVGSAFIAACESLRPHLTASGCSGKLLYFGDFDPKGLWIPARASKDSGIEAQPEEALYALLLAKGRRHRDLPQEPISFDSGLLTWLPAHLREETGGHFINGQRLPQELVSLPDLCEQTVSVARDIDPVAALRTMNLSKSDFKVARTCGTKLFYRKLRYPSNLDDDPYLEFLADGGYMVETLAKLLFPEGREIAFDSSEQALAETKEALQNESVTLFEATFLFGQLLARVDILEKRGNRLRFIEVKAKSFNSQTDGNSPFRGKRGAIASKWQPYLEDVAFQTHILRSLFPHAQIAPCLCLVDKSKRCNTDTSFENFQVVPREKKQDEKIFSRPQVVFTGDVESLRNNPFVTVVDVSDEVDELMPIVKDSAAAFAATLTGDSPTRIAPTLGVQCKKCEYRLEDGARSGFDECWGRLADASPHLLDFYRVDVLGPKGQVAADMIAQGRCAIQDVDANDLRGKVGERQAIQLRGTLQNEEFINPQLREILAQCNYPLHFVDFEACRAAVPYHAGMHPYEQVAFQWSCHSIPAVGEEIIHNEWINIEDAYPNFAFARALREVVTGNGTIFVWSHFEKTALKDVRRQLVQYQQQDHDLANWLDSITSDHSPLVDLCELAKEHYFHPRMAGSLSIKYVLPAVWFQNAHIRSHPWFSQYVREKDGQLLEPYQALDPLPFGDDAIEDEGEVVREGTGAIRTYQEMMYGLHRSDVTFRNTYKKLLLNYCKLDTAAMVMIWMHWTDKHRPSSNLPV